MTDKIFLTVHVSDSDELLLHWSHGQVEYLDNTFCNILRIMWWAITQRRITKFEFPNGRSFTSKGESK